MRSQTLTILLVLAFLGTPCVQAAECEIKDTLISCWENATLGAEAREAQETVRANETGVDTAGANLGTNKKDFLSPLNLVALLGEQTSGVTDEDGTLVMDLNFILPCSIERNGQLKLVLDTEATLFEPLNTSLKESGDEDVLEEVNDSLGDLGEYSVSFAYNWDSARLGRYFSEHRDLFEALVRATDPDPEIDQDVFLRFLSLAQGLTDACVDTSSCDCDDGAVKCTFVELSGSNLQNAERLRAVFEQAAAQERDLASQQRELIAAQGIKHFAALVDNQPQLHFSLELKIREDLVGPDEWAGELTYEWPLAPNVNRMRKALARREEQADGHNVTRVDRLGFYGDYVREVEDRLDSSDRFSLSIKYLDRDSLDIDLPGDLENFTAESSRELIMSLGWGRVLEANEDGTAKSRVDLKGSFEDVSSDPARTDRTLVTLTVTRDFGNYSIPLGIVYSNKPEFLAMQDLDEQLSAHVGVKFDFDKKDAKTK